MTNRDEVGNTPAGGVSDEEIADFIESCYDEDMGFSIPVEVVKKALSKWGAQPEYDPTLVSLLVNDVLVSESALPHLKDTATVLRSSRRPKGRVVKGWAVLDPNGKIPLIAILDENEARLWRPENDVHPCRIEILDAPEAEEE